MPGIVPAVYLVERALNVVANSTQQQRASPKNAVVLYMEYQWCHKVLRPGRGGKGAGPGEAYLELYPDVLVARFPGDAGGKER